MCSPYHISPWSLGAGEKKMWRLCYRFSTQFWIIASPCWYFVPKQPRCHQPSRVLQRRAGGVDGLQWCLYDSSASACTKKMSFAVIDAKQGCKLFGCRTSQAVNYLGAEQVSCKDLDVVLSQIFDEYIKLAVQWCFDLYKQRSPAVKEVHINKFTFAFYNSEEQ